MNKKKPQTEHLRFASEPAEAAYKAALKAKVKITRDQVRVMLQVFSAALDDSKRRFEKMHERRGEEEAKNWFTNDRKPKKVGVYRTSQIGSCHLGWGYNYWNGKDWERFLDRRDCSRQQEFLWVGDKGSKMEPFKMPANSEPAVEHLLHQLANPKTCPECGGKNGSHDYGKCVFLGQR
jgi:hypothetical protein